MVGPLATGFGALARGVIGPVVAGPGAPGAGAAGPAGDGAEGAEGLPGVVGLPTCSSWTSHLLIDLVAAHTLFVHQTCFAMKEAAGLRESGWFASAVAWLAIVVLCTLDVATNLLPGPMVVRIAAVLVLAVVTAVATTVLFMRRHELTR